MAAGAPVVRVRGRRGPLASAVRQELRHFVPARHRDGGQALHVSAGTIFVRRREGAGTAREERQSRFVQRYALPKRIANIEIVESNNKTME